MGELSLADRAYAAALLDDRAILRLRKAAVSDLPAVLMSGGRLETLQWLGELTGTKVTIVNRDYTRHGCAEHCPDMHQHIVSASGRWSVTGTKATIMLWNVVDYMHLQQPQAHALIDAGLETRWLSHTVESMVARGWDIPPLRNQRRSRALRSIS